MKTANDVEARFDTSGYNKTDFRPLPIGLHKKVIGLMKDELGGKTMTEFVALRPKLYSYKKLGGSEDNANAKESRNALSKIP